MTMCVPSKSPFIVTDSPYGVHGEDLPFLLEGVEYVLVEKFGMKLLGSKAMRMYARMGMLDTTLPPALRPVSFDVGMHYLPQYHNTLELVRVVKHDGAGERIVGQFVPSGPLAVSRMATPAATSYGGVKYEVYPLFGILGHFVYGGVQIHLVRGVHSLLALPDYRVCV